MKFIYKINNYKDNYGSKNPDYYHYMVIDSIQFINRKVQYNTFKKQETMNTLSVMVVKLITI